MFSVLATKELLKFAYDLAEHVQVLRSRRNNEQKYGGTICVFSCDQQQAV